ncbi:putative mannosyltransferase ktr4 [Hypoxylon texense]
MSERKVLTKYYPPDFDPSQLKRVRGPKAAGPKVQTVRLAAPFSMKCTSCGEYIYKGRKFNARKETPQDEKYLGIQIFRFYIRCTRCSGQITFKTDPKNQDYACESGAKRSTEPWRVGNDETDEQRLDRLEREEEEERNAMVELEAKTVDAKREMAVADALDEIRTRNARLERANADGVEVGVAAPVDTDAERQEREDAEAAKRAFEFARQVDSITEEVLDDGMDDAASASTSASASTFTPETSGSPAPKSEPTPAVAATTATTASKDMPPPSFKRVVKKKKDHSAMLGIKKKPSLV